MTATPGREALLRFVWLSIGAALATIGLKTTAYVVTDSVGLLSDALESGINLLTALLAFVSLRVAARPPDEDHAYGHEKAEYFSSGVEGLFITGAAAGIVYAAIRRLLDPRLLHDLGVGLAISFLASLINLAVAQILIHAGRRHSSIALEAGGKHLMTDVWTSAGVLAAIGAVSLTGWQLLDPLIALGVAAHIVWVGAQLVQRSILGLMDTALPQRELKAIIDILESYAGRGIRYHALRTRQAAVRSFVSVHIQVPGDWSVQKGHDLLEEIEARIRRIVPRATILTHIEPIEDPFSFLDQQLDRAELRHNGPGKNKTKVKP